MAYLPGLRGTRQRTGYKLGDFTKKVNEHPAAQVRGGWSYETLSSIDIGRRSASPELTNVIVDVLRDLGQDVTADQLTVPDRPPKQPAGPKGPVRRQDKEGGKKGPKRAQGVAA